jgi:hypothetical protein
VDEPQNNHEEPIEIERNLTPILVYGALVVLGIALMVFMFRGYYSWNINLREEAEANAAAAAAATDEDPGAPPAAAPSDSQATTPPGDGRDEPARAIVKPVQLQGVPDDAE